MKNQFTENNAINIVLHNIIYDKNYVVFQAPCQVELENWVNSIHSACGAAFARHRGKIGTLHLLQEEIYRIEKQVEAVCIFNFFKLFL